MGVVVLVLALAHAVTPTVAAQTSVPTQPSVLPTEPNFAYFATPRDTTGCPFATTPPPVVDESEVAQPGATVPPPPPVPETPVGGARLGGCTATAVDGLTVPAELTASAWILVDVQSRKVLATKDPHGRYRPASIIKVLLALVVLDELDLNQTVTVSADDIAEAEGTLLGIGPGGTYTIGQLLGGMLMLSGNDAAYALAAQLGGVAQTLDKMNAKCLELGCSDTSAQSVSGLDKPGNMTSAYDMALVFAAALAREEFRTYISTRSMGFPGYPANDFTGAPDPQRPVEPTVGVPDDRGVTYNADGTATTATGETFHPGFIVYNDNKLLAQYDGALGGKTGFTDDARQTYMGAAERDGRRLLVVLLDGTRLPRTPVEQTSALFDAGFATDPDSGGVGELVGGTVDTATAGTAAAAVAVGAGSRSPAKWVLAGVLSLALLVVVGLIVRVPRR